MSNIEILTKGYADSVFASGPVVKEITSSDGSVSVFVDGPTVDLKVKSGGDALEGPSVSITGYNTVNLMSGTMAPLVSTAGIKLDGTDVDIEGRFINLHNFGSNASLKFDLNSDGSIYVNGPITFKNTIKDKNGQEITGGGGGSASLPHIKDEVGNTVFISGPAVIGTASQGPESPALIFGTSTGSGDYLEGNKGQIGIYADTGGVDYFGMSTPGFHGSGGASIYVQDYMGIAYIGLRIGEQECQLSENDLRKLREILDAHS